MYRPQLVPGEHRLQARLFQGQEEISATSLRVQLVDGLSLASVLVHPHPVWQSAAFTFVLSHPAEVRVEIYSLSGRLVRRLESVSLPAGFGRIPWDARNQAGSSLASGTYLYRLIARAGALQARHIHPLVVLDSR